MCVYSCKKKYTLLTQWGTLFSRFNEADLKAEDAERKVTSLENELGEKEQLHEELEEKYKTAKAELDELARQFDEL